MSSPVPITSEHDAQQRWIAWQNRGVEGDRRRTVAIAWLMALTAIALGVLFGRVF